MAQFNDSEQNARLMRMRAEEEEALARTLSERHGIGYTDLSIVPVNTDALRVVPEADAQRAELVVFDIAGKRLSIGVRSPEKPETRAVLADLETRGFIPTLFMVSTQSLSRAWEHYKDLSFATETREGSLEISNEEIAAFLEKVHSADDARAFIDETLRMKKAFRISRIVEVLLASATATGASDLHVEPEEAGVRLRFRLDGILTDVGTTDEETYKLLLSRIKLLSGLKLNVHDEAQDGRFSIEIRAGEMEVRTSVIPSQYGESIVLRILNPETILVPMEKLGMDPYLLSIMEREIAQPNGMILTTGPTGSGKTTMLYAFLRKVHNPEVKIITIEDPVEYHLTGIVQTQVDADGEYTFASGLRSVLRQDPDIIMVGEIRDSETAETAVNAALTGHLVLSTLHTNNAAGAFPRLFDLGVSTKVASSAIRIAMAQRLVRRLCQECKKETDLSEGLQYLVDKVLDGIVDKERAQKRTQNRTHAWEPVGCSACGGTGYKGRIGIFEGIKMDEMIDEVVRTNPSERAIAEAARPQGIFNMQEDGVLKVLEGVTSLTELMRVIELGT